MKSISRDRKKVARLQPHEVRYVARKFGLYAKEIRLLIKLVGNSRPKVVKAAQTFKDYLESEL